MNYSIKHRRQIAVAGGKLRTVQHVWVCSSLACMGVCLMGMEGIMLLHVSNNAFLKKGGHMLDSDLRRRRYTSVVGEGDRIRLSR